MHPYGQLPAISLKVECLGPTCVVVLNKHVPCPFTRKGLLKALAQRPAISLYRSLLMACLFSSPSQRRISFLEIPEGCCQFLAHFQRRSRISETWAMCTLSLHGAVEFDVVGRPVLTHLATVSIPLLEFVNQK